MPVSAISRCGHAQIRREGESARDSQTCRRIQSSMPGILHSGGIPVNIREIRCAPAARASRRPGVQPRALLAGSSYESGEQDVCSRKAPDVADSPPRAPPRRPRSNNLPENGGPGCSAMGKSGMRATLLWTGKTTIAVSRPRRDRPECAHCIILLSAAGPMTDSPAPSVLRCQRFGERDERPSCYG